MPVERRERVIAICIGSTGNGRNPMFNGRRQPSCGGTSRMNREVQVRFCERLGVKFPGPTRHGRSKGCICNETAVTHGVKNSVEMYASHESRLKILHADAQRRSRSAPGQHYTRGSS